MLDPSLLAAVVGGTQQPIAAVVHETPQRVLQHVAKGTRRNGLGLVGH